MSIDIKDWFWIIKMVSNVITEPVMKLEHFEDLSFFRKTRTFLCKKILNDYVRVLDLYPIFTPTFK